MRKKAAEQDFVKFVTKSCPKKAGDVQDTAGWQPFRLSQLYRLERSSTSRPVFGG